jgi:putative peptidoglycan lipid II flippase
MSEHREHHRLLKSASLITLITILSRIFGYIRDSRIAYLLGTGAAADAFTIAYRIPNLLRRLVGEGAISAAFIPVFSRYVTEEDRKQAWEFANAFLTLISAIVAAVTVLGILFSPSIVPLLAWGFRVDPAKFALTTLLNRIMFPYIFLICISGFCMGVLNSFHRFAAPAFAPVLMNLSVITFSFFAGSFSQPSVALAIGVVAGGILQVAIQLPALRRSGFRFRFLWRLENPGVRRVGKLLVPVAFGVGIVQFNVLIGSQFASFLPEGNVMAMYLADRVMELVLGAYSIAVSTAVLPLLSRQAAQGRMDEMKMTLNFALRLVLFITVPSAVGLIILREPVIEVLFRHGDFTAASAALTTWPLLFFSLGLPAFSMVKIIVPVFYALHDTRTPVKVAFVSLLVNVGLNLLLIQPLQSGGLALGTVVAALFNCVALMLIFHRRHGAFAVWGILASTFKFCIGSALLGCAAYFTIRWPGLYEGSGIQKALALGTSIGVAVGIYFSSMYLMKSRELHEVKVLWRMLSRS